MFQLVKRIDLDIEKYNHCIANSLQSRIYAFSWYLDCVSENWEVLVQDDYKAVMPLPVKKKFFISYITQPFFTQQLGVFSIEKLSQSCIELFIKNIPKRHIRIALQLNAANEFKSKKLVAKQNYLLPLNSDYQTLRRRFSKGRKSAITKAEKQQLIVEEIGFEELLSLSKKYYSFEKIGDKEYKKLVDLVAVAAKKNRVKVIGVTDENQLEGGAVFLFDAHRITYLFSAVSSKGRTLQIPSLLLNYIIKNNANSSLVLDFEGSGIPNIASFFKSFGAKTESYFLFRK